MGGGLGGGLGGGVRAFEGLEDRCDKIQNKGTREKTAESIPSGREAPFIGPSPHPLNYTHASICLYT